MNTALLVLRLVAGLLFMGHGLQKLVRPKDSPRYLSAIGPEGFAAGLEKMGMRPAYELAIATGVSELVGGALLALGLITPIATVLLAAVMTVAIVRVHLRNGIWNTAGGFEFPLLMVTCAYAVTAIGPGRFSLDALFGIGNWPGLDVGATAWWAAVALAIGAAGGAVMALWAVGPGHPRRAHPAH